MFDDTCTTSSVINAAIIIIVSTTNSGVVLGGSGNPLFGFTFSCYNELVGSSVRDHAGILRYKQIFVQSSIWVSHLLTQEFANCYTPSPLIAKNHHYILQLHQVD